MFNVNCETVILNTHKKKIFYFFLLSLATRTSLTGWPHQRVEPLHGAGGGLKNKFAYKISQFRRDIIIGDQTGAGDFKAPNYSPFRGFLAHIPTLENIKSQILEGGGARLSMEVWRDVFI